MDWKKLLWIDKRTPKSSYILRAFVGIYLIYIVYKVVSGLGEEGVSQPALVIVAAVVFSLFSVLCLLSGGLGLYQEYYGEADGADETLDTGADSQEEEEEEIHKGNKI